MRSSPATGTARRRPVLVLVVGLVTGLLLADVFVASGPTAHGAASPHRVDAAQAEQPEQPDAAPAEQPDPDPCAGAGPAPVDDAGAIAAVHRDAVDCLWQLGVLQGDVDVDGRVHVDPQGEITRAQLAGLVHRLLGDREDGRFKERRRPRFDDVPAGSTFDEAIHALAAVGVVRGVDERRFDPAAPVRRDQLASVLVRGAAFATGRTLAPVAGPYYLDVVTGVHRDAIDAGFESGVITGVRRPCGDGLGRFTPGASAQRQQTASMLVRLLRSLDAIEAGTHERQRADAVCPPLTWTPDIGAARAYGELRAGDVSFAAIGTDGQSIGHRAATPVAAASVLKVMFLVAYLRQPDVRDRALGPADRALLEPMIRRSADQPATDIANRLGPRPIEQLAERAGMRDFAYTRPWGLSQTSARDQARFMLELDDHLPARHRDYALQLLGDIVETQRWGIGQLDMPGWTTRFKGGWGARTGAVNHQVVRLEHRDGTVVAVAVMTTSNRDHDDGSTTLEGVFARLVADLP